MELKNLKIDAILHRKLKVFCAERHYKISVFVSNAIRDKMKEEALK